MPRFVEIGGCPVPTGHEFDLAVRYVIARTGATPVTVYRGSEPSALRILHANGKHSQGELANATAAQKAAWGIRGSANPEGGSTHDLHKGGAFPGNPTDPIPDYECGMDWPDWAVPAVIRAFSELGMGAWRPYPGSPNETQHVCCRKPPRFTTRQRLLVEPLKPRAKGEAVRAVQILLVRGGFLPADFDVAEKVGTYGPAMVAAAKRAQRKLGLTPDGVIGVRTFDRLQSRYGWRVWKGVLARRRKRKTARR